MVMVYILIRRLDILAYFSDAINMEGKAWLSPEIGLMKVTKNGFIPFTYTIYGRGI